MVTVGGASFMETNSYKNLFSNCTENVPGDGNCFIHSFMKLYPGMFPDVITARQALYDVSVKHFGKKFVNNDRGYADLRKNGVWVDVTAGATAMSLLTNRPVIIVFEHGAIIAENGKVRILDAQEKNNYILAGADAIVYHSHHFQPLSRKTEIRKQFVSGTTEIEKNQRNKQNLKAIKEAHPKKSFSSPKITQQKQESREQILIDAINNAFTGNNRLQAVNTVNEILSMISNQEEKENMITILLCGIIAEHEREEKESTHEGKKSILASIPEAKVKANKHNEKIKAKQPQIKTKMPQLI